MHTKFKQLKKYTVKINSTIIVYRIPALTDSKNKCPATSPLLPSIEVNKLKSELIQWKSVAELTSSLVTQLDSEMMHQHFLLFKIYLNYDPPDRWIE
jgi:hypothetical protein